MAIVSPFIPVFLCMVSASNFSKYPPAIPGVDPFPFPELNPRLHPDIQLAFNAALLKKKRRYTGKESLKGQVILDGF